MNIKTLCTPVTVGLYALFFISSSTFADTNDERIARSQLIIGEYQKRLKGELVSAMKNGGPVVAIGVCKEAAPQIGAEVSEKYGVTISRTSTRYRNSESKPEAWEMSVIKKYLIASNIKGNKINGYAEVSPTNHFRYMQPIKTAPVCLACHGKNISADVSKALTKHYPQDLATGYEQGDIRGFFSVTWPIKKTDTQ